MTMPPSPSATSPHSGLADRPSSGPGLPLAAYRTAISLDEPFLPSTAPAPPDRLDERVRTALRLLSDDPAVPRLGLRPDALRDLVADGASARRLLRALLTVRPPGALPDGVTEALDAVLGAERDLRPTVRASRLPTIAARFPHSPYRAADRTALWRGDITTLSTDAIVNAANSALLGCFQPLHACIDNAIHSAAGPRLRDDCQTVVTLQGTAEPTGTAKITRGYHLPARYVLHTVGPITDGRPRADDEEALAAAYRACLDLAAEVGSIRTVALCAVSTGVFGYPKEQAAPLALRTVADWLDTYPGRFDRVVFTVFGAADENAYRQALRSAPNRTHL